MEKIAFVMQLKAGHEQEYQQRHDAIWPELVVELKNAGIHDYTIFLHPTTLQLFAVLKRSPSHTMDDLPSQPIMQKWWQAMADIMETNADASPIATDLTNVFHLD
ncbi:L-rhamnose mutarotase [Halioxenophilus aromaticivorans]|uniref:L-rhamnose mutarotase n=1 Tax=Halioxenophilus aromaticivorans TaxID=1306992 RepID=A0AAV3U874_9ALTE